MKTQKHTQGQGDLPHELSQPTQRALARAGIPSLEELAKFSQAEIKQLQGIEPNAIGQLHRGMDANGLSFTDGQE